MQIIFYLMAILAIYLFTRKNVTAGKMVFAILAILWLWMGIAYHLVFFTSINKGAYLFGILFILQGLLFIYSGVIRNKFAFTIQFDIYGVSGILLLLFALLIYPVIGHFAGHAYPASPTFGLPCPTTIFTFGLLLLVSKIIPAYVLVIPFLWSLLGFSAAFSLGIYEDTGLLISGLISVPMILIRNKKIIRHI